MKKGIGKVVTVDEAEKKEPTALSRVQRKMQPVIEQAKLLVITSNPQYLVAGEQRQVIKGLLKEIDELMDPIVQAAHQAHKVAVGQKKSVAFPLEQADAALSHARLKWSDEQEKVRLAEQRRLQEEADRLTKRLMDEERERLLAEATEMAEAGDHAGAMELMDVEPEVQPVEVEAVQSYVPKQEGLSGRTTWSAEVTDLPTLVKAVAEGRAPIQCLEANMPFLNKQATAFRGALDIPGVKARAKSSESVRA